MGKLSKVGLVLLGLAMMLVAQTPAVLGVEGTAAAASGSTAQSAPPAGAPLGTQSATPSLSPESAIRSELEEQVTAWNRGDLKGYMQGYWNSPQLTFFAGSKESAGWEAAYRRYRSAYLGKDRQMGSLKFTHLRVEVLSPESAFVRGGWQLTMKNGSQRSGLFTVVLRKFSEGWRIIHDHSS